MPALSLEAGGGGWRGEERTGCFLAGVPQLPAPPPRPGEEVFLDAARLRERMGASPFLQAEKVKETGHVND